MNTRTSLLVAKDIQLRRHAEAKQRRRHAAPERTETVALGRRWVARLESTLPRRLSLPGRVEVRRSAAVGPDRDGGM